MTFRIVSEVEILGMVFTDEYYHKFSENSNVFGRVLEYHKRMYKVYPNRPFRLVKATLVKEDK